MSRKICCEDCRHCFPITKGEANTVCRKISIYGLQDVIRKVRLAVAYALKHCGICAWEMRIVGLDDEACEEHWRDK